MSSIQNLTRVGLTGIALLCLLGGCRNRSEPSEALIDPPDLIDAGRNAEPPKTNFPAELQQADKTLNEFVMRVLDTCHRGDYDGFCKYLGTAETPPSQEGFGKLWHVVSDIDVRSIHSDGKTPPTYYVHAIAKLRKPDSKGHTEKHLVVRAFKEMGQWRVAAASKEAGHKVLAADSQPASGPAATDKPAQTGRSAAPTAGPAVYKNRLQGS